MTDITLFCFPHAGGGAHCYAPLGPCLPAAVDLRPLEPPGRGRRAREPLCSDLEAMASDLFTRMAPVARQGPYALFGHSMGGLLAYLCAGRAVAAGLPRPWGCFFLPRPRRAEGTSACPAPWPPCPPRFFGNGCWPWAARRRR
jgi:surfactin synthase thioesterase subunit